MNRILLTSVSFFILSGAVYANDYKQDYIETPTADTKTVTQTVKDGVSNAADSVVDTTKNAVQKTKDLIIPPPIDLSAEQQEETLLAPNNAPKTSNTAVQATPVTPPPPQDNVVRIRPTQPTETIVDNSASVPPQLSPQAPVTAETTQLKQKTMPVIIEDPLKDEDPMQNRQQPVIEKKTTQAPTPIPAQDKPVVQKSADMNNTNDMCASGKMQSPVNIAAYRPDADLTPVQINYQMFPLKLSNMGDTVEIIAPRGNSITMNGQSYALKYVHFHAPSDHYFKGVPYAMEAHFIHQDDNGNYAALASLIKVGKDNPTIQNIWKNIPANKGAIKTTNQAININNLLPQNPKYYTYKGSLMVPPCQENVTWVVMQTPIDIGQDQLGAFQTVFPANTRQLQQLNGRVIKGTP